MNIDGYEIGKSIGKGSYGRVYKVVNKENNKHYAMKKLKVHPINPYEKINIVNELRILMSHTSSFIIRFKDAFIHNNSLCIVTEWAEKGDLANIIKTKSKQNIAFTENEIWHYFLQLSVAISYLHKINIIHRDIKPANVFIDINDNVKLGDFGITKVLKHYMMYGQTQIGTPLYMSPEIFKRERYDVKVDVWALGCILYELMTLKPAFTAKSIVELKDKIYAGRIQYCSNYTSTLTCILKSLINIQPRLRPSIVSLLNIDHVQTQLKLRRLSLESDTEINAAFFRAYVIPKKIVDWNDIINNHRNTHNFTIVRPSDAQHVECIKRAKEVANRIALENDHKKKDLIDRIANVNQVIQDAHRIIEQNEIKLQTLKQELRDIDYRPCIPPVTPQSPKPIKHTPKYNPIPLTPANHFAPKIPQPPRTPRPPKTPRPAMIPARPHILRADVHITPSRPKASILGDIAPTPKRSERYR